MTDEVSEQTPEEVSVKRKQLEDSLLAVPGVISKQDEILEAVGKLTEGLGSLSKRMDDIEKAKSTKQDDEDKDDDDKVEINIEDDDKKDDYKDMKDKKKKSDDFEAIVERVKKELTKPEEVKKEEVPKVEPIHKDEGSGTATKEIEKTDSVEPTAPPAADRPIQKNVDVGYLQQAANEINKFGTWRKFAEEKRNANVITKMEEDIAMYKGMEESRKQLESVQVNTQAPPVNELKRGGFIA